MLSIAPIILCLATAAAPHHGVPAMPAGQKQDAKKDAKKDAKQDAKQDAKRDPKQDAKKDAKHAEQGAEQDAKQDAKETKSLPPYRIVGTVVDPNGKPIAGAGLAVFTDGTPDAARTRKDPLAETDADGRLDVTVPRVEGSTPTVLLSAPGHICVQLGLRSTEQKVDGKTVANVDIGDIVLREGIDVSGLIRNDAGEPLVGATVRATGILSRLFAPQSGTVSSSSAYVSAVSGERGIVRLYGIPKVGVSVEVTADGHYPKRIPYLNRHVPLVATLTKGGDILGRVVDAAGKPVESAQVRIYSESASSGAYKKTGADGTFRMPVPGPGRYRIRFYAKLGNAAAYTTKWSDVLQGPQEDLVLAFGDRTEADAAQAKDGARAGRHVEVREAQRVKKGNRGLIVRVTDKRTGVPPKDVKAAVLWWQPNMWEHNRGYLRRQLRDVETDEQGRVELPKPGQGQPLTGRVLVVAKGFAPRVIKDVDWNEEAKVNEIAARLEPESVLRGLIEDDRGRPVAGARVLVTSDPLALRNYVPEPMRRKLDDEPSIVKTDAKGAFRVESLARGTHTVYIAHPDYADAEPQQVEVEAGENELALKIRKGPSLHGKLVGVEPRTGWRVRIQRLPESRNRFSSYHSLNADQASEFVPVAADGTFLIEGLTRANYLLALQMPGGQGRIEVPIEPFRIRSKDLNREFDVSEELPGKLVGKVVVRGAALPPGRLLLLASERGEQPRSYYSNRPNLVGQPALIAADGSFAVDLPDGSYQLRLVDLATAVTLYQRPESVRVKATATTTIDLAADLAPVTVTLVPEKEDSAVAVNRVEIRVTHPPLPGDQQQNVVFGGSDQYRGIGIEIEPGQTEVRLVLPCVPTRLLVRSDAHNLDPKVNAYNFPAQGEAELEPKSGESNRVEIRVAQPELDFGDAKK